MPQVINWQLGRPIAFPTRRNTRAAICLRFQHQSLHWLPDMHDGLQEHLDILARPRIHVVEQCRNETLRWLPAVLGRQVAGPAGGSQPGRPELERRDSRRRDEALWDLRRQDDLRGRPDDVGPEGSQVALGYLPTDAEWRHPNIHEDTATGGQWKEMQFGGSAQLPEHRVWFFHLARICNHCTYPGCLASCPRQAIYKRPEDGIVLIDQERCRGYRKCVEGCPYKKTMYRGTTRTSEKCVGCYPRIEGKDETLSSEGVRVRPAAWRPVSAKSGSRVWSRSPRTARGPAIRPIPSIS